jgi:pSer/pThr/pTyr-binding forkhead associated (FHA) protein
MPALQRLQDGQPGDVIQLRQGASTVGRAAGNAVQLSSRLVSKRHVQLMCSGDECVIEDISTNGTLVNGRRLAGRVARRLQHGDRIDIGDESFLFLTTESPEDQSGAESLRPNLAVVAPTADDPDASIMRCLVRIGDTIIRPADGAMPKLDDRKVVVRLPLVELPMRQLTGMDSTRRLSQVLRAAELACRTGGGGGLAALGEFLLEVFPSSSAVTMLSESPDRAEWKVRWAAARAGSAVTLMEPVLWAAVSSCGAFLIADQCRSTDSVRPLLSELDRCSAMCVPLRSEGGSCCGAILLSADAAPPFDQDDLERLTAIGQVLAPVFAGKLQQELSMTRTIVRRESAGRDS